MDEEGGRGEAGAVKLEQSDMTITCRDKGRKVRRTNGYQTVLVTSNKVFGTTPNAPVRRLVKGKVNCPRKSLLEV